MIRRRHLLLAAAVAVVLAAITAVWAGTDWLDAGAPTRLRVEVTGLPDQVAAAVTIAGPVTYSIIGHTDEREVPAGDYALRIGPVDTELGRAYAEHDETPIRVAGGTTTAVAAEYVVIIPATTTVLDATNPGIVAVAGRTVTFAATPATETALRPGTMFVVAEGPRTPDPMARRVDSVRRTTAGLVVETTPVTLSEALPAGRFTLDEPDNQMSFRPVAYEPDPLLSINFAELIALHAQAEAGKPGGVRGTGSCSGSTPRELSLNVHSLRPKLGGRFDWGLLPPKATVKITATLNPEVSFKAKLAAALDCGLRFENDRGIKWLNNLCGKVVGKLARVGPVSLHCKVKPFVKVGVGTQTAASVGFDATLHVGIKDSEETLTMSDPRLPESPVQQIVDGVDSSMSTGVELGLSVGLYGSDPSDTAWLGLKLELAAGPEFVVRADRAEANLTFRLTLTAELKLDARFKDWKKSRKLAELDKKLRVWQSDSGSFQTRTTHPPAKPTLETVPVQAIPDCAGGGCTAVALAENVRPGIHVALVTKSIDRGWEKLFIVSFRSEREYVDSSEMLRDEDVLFIPEPDIHPLTCDPAARCFVIAAIGAHSQIAGVAELDDAGRFHQRGEHIANIAIHPMDLDGDRAMELVKYSSDGNPDHATGARFWEALSWNGADFASQGCRPATRGETRPSGPVSPAECP